MKLQKYGDHITRKKKLRLFFILTNTGDWTVLDYQFCINIKYTIKLSGPTDMTHEYDFS